MLRKITKPIGRFRKAGVEHDYPQGVWNKIAADLGVSLEDFSVKATSNVVLQSPLKGKLNIHKRLGATQ